jgi:hypothetical protein
MYINEINGNTCDDETIKNHIRMEHVSIHFGEGWRSGDGVGALGINDDIKSVLVDSASNKSVSSAFDQPSKNLSEIFKKIVPDLTVTRKYIKKKKKKTDANLNSTGNEGNWIGDFNFGEKDDNFALTTDLGGLLIVGDIHGYLQSLFTVLEIVDKMLIYHKIDDGRCGV